MYIDRVGMKRQAKSLISSSKPEPVLVSLVYVVVSALIAYLYSRIAGFSLNQAEMQELIEYAASGNADVVSDIISMHMPSTAGELVGLLLTIVSTMLSAGFTIFTLNTIRRTAPCYGNLLDGFGMFLRIIILSFLNWLFVFLWSLLFVIPGIIAAYRYRLALYLLLDHPEMSPMQCIRESKRIMQGHKGELFVLDLSFIGWNILTSIPVVGYFVMLWVLPYTELTYSLFYTTLTGTTALGAAPGGQPEGGEWHENPPWEN